MSRYLQAQSADYPVLLDCRAVQEVGEWHGRGRARQEAAWRGQTLPLAHLSSLLHGTSAHASHYVVLDTELEEMPRMMLLVDHLASLVDLDDTVFQTPLANTDADSGLYDAAHNPDRTGILLRLDPRALAEKVLAGKGDDA